MLSDIKYLALRLEGPLQSWGFDSQYNRRNTGLMPTKSAIAGMCCAALGYERGGEKEAAFLAEFEGVKMTAIAIPRNGSRKTLAVRRLQDYHTVQNTKTADGKMKDCHITHRQYLTDASFGIILSGNVDLLERISKKLEDPVWGLWLGRKTCIPSAPILAGLQDTKEEAVKLLIGEASIESLTRQEDVETFSEGKDSLPDRPGSFASDRRMFSPRRVITRHGS
ncbi:MAG: type I-E CRISPR-associated protein Cas5/CasD [Dissulfurispiraceae bacterium]|jgi:CRISPR system Cascade subunit CasD